MPLSLSHHHQQNLLLLLLLLIFLFFFFTTMASTIFTVHIYVMQPKKVVVDWRNSKASSALLQLSLTSRLILRRIIINYIATTCPRSIHLTTFDGTFCKQNQPTTPSAAVVAVVAADSDE